MGVSVGVETSTLFLFLSSFFFSHVNHNKDMLHLIACAFLGLFIASLVAGSFTDDGGII